MTDTTRETLIGRLFTEANKADDVHADLMREAADALAAAPEQAPAVQAGALDEREAFEQWAWANSFNTHRDETEKYRDYHRATTRFAWQAWQARAAIAQRAALATTPAVQAEQPAEPVAEYTKLWGIRWLTMQPYQLPIGGELVDESGAVHYRVTSPAGMDCLISESGLRDGTKFYLRKPAAPRGQAEDAQRLTGVLRELLEAEEAVFPPFEAGKAAQDQWATRKTAARFAARAAIDAARASDARKGEAS